jgi:UDP-N-acetylenolpyruvoylglucosamine reductase
VNPELKITNKKLLEKYPELNGYNEKGIIPAGYLIAKSGLAGKKIGNAQISEKHSNFIINSGFAKSKDVLSLINLAKKEVNKNFDIDLETEVQLVGAF